MTPTQQKSWDRYRDDFLVPVARNQHSTSIAEAAEIDWDGTFGRSAPRIVELGTGGGEALVAGALANPDLDFIGFEVFQPAIASVLGKIGNAQVSNVRIVLADAVAGLTQLFEPESLAEIWTFFADPWHKTRHHKRRLISADFVTLGASRLAPGGVWRSATDWDDYATWQREIFDAEPELANLHADWAPRAEIRPVTKYEQRGINAGRQIYDLEYQKVQR